MRCPKVVFLNPFSRNFRTPMKALVFLHFEVVIIEFFKLLFLGGVKQGLGLANVFLQFKLGAN